jgi:predicted nucleic acid-binding protein
MATYVIADSGPLINLARIRRFELLRELYGTIIIPAQVHAEIVIAGAGRPGSIEVAAAPWCQPVDLHLDLDAARASHPKLGPGELAAIMTAVTLRAELLLCDDAAARDAAEELGLNVRGTLGILVEARNRNLLPSVKDAIAEMLLAKAWLAPELIRRALRKAGELPDEG